MTLCVCVYNSLPDRGCHSLWNWQQQLEQPLPQTAGVGDHDKFLRTELAGISVRTLSVRKSDSEDAYPDNHVDLLDAQEAGTQVETSEKKIDILGREGLRVFANFIYVWPFFYFCFLCVALFSFVQILLSYLFNFLTFICIMSLACGTVYVENRAFNTLLDVHVFVWLNSSFKHLSKCVNTRSWTLYLYYYLTCKVSCICWLSAIIM